MAYIDNLYYQNTYCGVHDFDNADIVFARASDIIDIYSGFKARLFFGNSNGFFDSQIMRAVALQADFMQENNLVSPVIKMDENSSSEAGTSSGSSSSNDDNFSQISLGKFSYKLGSSSSSTSSSSSSSSSKESSGNGSIHETFEISPMSFAILEDCGFTSRNISI